jgi:Sigma-70, region 4
MVQPATRIHTAAGADRFARSPSWQQAAGRDALRGLIELPPEQRDTLALFILASSYDEIAAYRDVTKTNVNRHLARARAHLRLVRDEHRQHLTVPVAPTTRTGPQQRCVDRRGGMWTSVLSGVVRTAPESPSDRRGTSHICPRGCRAEECSTGRRPGTGQRLTSQGNAARRTRFGMELLR